jgi:hypothetical protein
MGCFVSGVEEVSAHPIFQDGFRRNPFSKVMPKPNVIVGAQLDDQTREVLYGILQRDAVTELAMGLDEWGNEWLTQVFPSMPRFRAQALTGH